MICSDINIYIYNIYNIYILYTSDIVLVWHVSTNLGHISSFYVSVLHPCLVPYIFSAKII